MFANYSTKMKGPTNYGYGWAIEPGNAPSFVEHGGAWNGYTSQIRRYLDDKFAVFVLCNRDDVDIGAIVGAAVTAYR
jgi:D-alanyl-D-alanine carboxypeptidase